MDGENVNTGIPVYGNDKDLVFSLGRAQALDAPVNMLHITDDMTLVETELKHLREIRQLMREFGASYQAHYAGEIQTLEHFITMLNCILAQSMKDTAT